MTLDLSDLILREFKLGVVGGSCSGSGFCVDLNDFDNFSFAVDLRIAEAVAEAEGTTTGCGKVGFVVAGGDATAAGVGTFEGLASEFADFTLWPLTEIPGG